MYLKFTYKQSSTQDSANKTSVQALILVLIVDKSVNHVLYRLLPNFVTAAAWCELICKPMEWQELLSFLSGGGGKKILFCNVFSDVIFYPRVPQ